MFILNINPANNYSNQHINFGNTSNFRTVKKIHLNAEQMNKINEISKSFDKVSVFFNSLNGILQKKFKTLYPGLAAGQKIKGFIFDTLLGGKNKNLQITRLNTREDSNELLTFGLMDSENNSILRYKIDKDGNMFVMKEKNNQDSVDTETFYDWDLNSFVKEMDYLRRYSESFKSVSRKVDESTSVEKMHEFLDEIVSLQNSKGLVNEIQNVKSAYADMNEVLIKKHRHDEQEMKQTYFGNLYQPKAKNMYFHDPESKKIYSYIPTKTNIDNRIFRLLVCDESCNPQEGFLFFDDGKIAKIRPDALGWALPRSLQLEYISDEMAEKLKLPEKLNVIINGFNDFKSFITEKRASETRRVGRPCKVKAASETDEVIKTKQQKKDVKISTSPIRSAVKAKQNKIKPDKIQSKPVQTISKPEHIIAVPEEITTLTEKSAAVKKTTGIRFSDINLSATAEKFNALFDTPIEERSPHLIHERLSNGRIFSGRVSIKASDGSEVSVSKVKSVRYVDFIYYSIKVTKDNKTYVMNLDPDMGLIIDSTPEGKVIIDKRQRIKHLSKKEFLEKYPEAESLGNYLDEIFEQKAGDKKIVDSKLKMHGLTLKEREREVLKALGMAPEIPLDYLKSKL